ncbi:glycosyltransferase family 1 protein [Clostridiaceae bacterium]|nr:glycosyltransferase family 1 protein [Clostridiaceae bacterium]
MKILHIGLASHFTEGMMYQDNLLAEACCKDGNQVIYISSIWRYENGTLEKWKAEDIILDSSIRLIRVPYDRMISRFLSSKFQKVSGLKHIIEEIEPDIIFYHNLVGRELLTVKDYIKKHPQIIFYADSHADFNNTARNFFSKIFYRTINRYYIRRSVPYMNKVFYLTEETRQFLNIMYQIDEKKMELLPLGGVMYGDEERQSARKKLLEELRIPEKTVLFTHSGKMSKEKRTLELMQAFSSVDNSDSRLLIFGAVSQDIQPEFMRLLEQDERLLFLGWKEGREIAELLLAADMYCQPGTESATLQTAICCGCAVMIYPHISYKGPPVFQRNGYFVESIRDMKDVFVELKEQPEKLELLKESSLELGKRYLDYRMQARRILGGGTGEDDEEEITG